VPDRAFNLGHRNYVTKPFSTPELLARIRAVLRRSRVQRERQRLSWGEMEVDFDARYVTVRGKEVHLTPKEFEWNVYETIARSWSVGRRL
jgi:DNA-binding response OmpR family regulator